MIVSPHVSPDSSAEMEMKLVAPEPRIDPHPDEGEAAGGVDAVVAPHPENPVTPEPPISAQVDEEAVPDALQEPEGADPDTVESQPDSEETTSEPTG